MSGEGSILSAKIDRARPALDIASSLFWLGPDPAAAYARYLTAMFPVARAAVPLLRFARNRCLGRPSDPISLPLARFLTGHIREERGHDAWIAADLRSLGRDDAAAAARLPEPSVAALIGVQYELIASVHPVALLGCIAVLEGQPPSDGLLEHVRQFADAPTALRTLSGHAASDTAHGAAIFAFLDGLRLNEQQRAAVGFSALHTIRQAIAMFAALAGEAAVPGPEAALGGLGAAVADREADMLTAIGQSVVTADVLAHGGGSVVGGLFL